MLHLSDLNSFGICKPCTLCEYALKALLRSWSRTPLCDTLVSTPDVFVSGNGRHSFEIENLKIMS